MARTRTRKPAAPKPLTGTVKWANGEDGVKYTVAASVVDSETNEITYNLQPDNDGEIVTDVPGSEVSAVRARRSRAKPSNQTDGETPPTVKGGGRRSRSRAQAKDTGTDGDGEGGTKTAPKNEPEPLVITEDIQAHIDGLGGAVAAADELYHRANATFYELGGVLAIVERDRAYQELSNLYTPDLEGFTAYLNDRFELSYRKAMFMIQMYRYFSGQGLTGADLRNLGWTKARAMLGVANKENFADLKEYAETHTREELEDHIRTVYKNKPSTGTADKGKKFSFKVFEADLNTVEMAIKVATEKTADGKMDQALILILTEWLEANSLDVPVEDAISNLEARYDVTVDGYSPNVPPVEGDGETQVQSD